jgi:hypothetical protein
MDVRKETGIDGVVLHLLAHGGDTEPDSIAGQTLDAGPRLIGASSASRNQVAVPAAAAPDLRRIDHVLSVASSVFTANA